MAVAATVDISIVDAYVSTLEVFAFSIGMDDPVKRLKELLGPPGNHPWAVLIPQILLWCFRRFCIDKIVSAELPIIESMWSDYIELLVQYSPKGLEAVASDWVSPTNIQHLVTPISEFNRFFTDFITKMDTCLLNDDVETQDILSEFIDTQMSTIINDWVTEEYKELFIFPVKECEDDNISHTRIGQLIQSLLSYYEKEETQNLIYSSPVITPPHLLWRCVLPPKEEPALEVQETQGQQTQGQQTQGQEQGQEQEQEAQTQEQEAQTQGQEQEAQVQEAQQQETQEQGQEAQQQETQEQEQETQEQEQETQEQQQETHEQEQEAQEEEAQEEEGEDQGSQEEDLGYYIQVGGRLPESDESRSSSPVMKANSTSAAFILRRETMRRSRMHDSSRVKTRKRYPHL